MNDRRSHLRAKPERVSPGAGRFYSVKGRVHTGVASAVGRIVWITLDLDHAEQLRDALNAHLARNGR